MRFLRLGLLTLGVFCSLAAEGGSLSVAPTRLELSAPVLTTSLTVTNTGMESSVLQLEAVDWSQENGEDIYIPSQELLATPPIFTLSPGASQIVRIGLRRSPDLRRELTYRLFLQEIPPPPQIGHAGLRVALRIGVPVFISAPEFKPELQIHARQESHDEWLFFLSNTGNSHLQIRELAVSAMGGKSLAASPPSAVYLLPGSERAWPMKFDTPVPVGAPLEMSIQSDQGELHVKIVVDR